MLELVLNLNSSQRTTVSLGFSFTSFSSSSLFIPFLSLRVKRLDFHLDRLYLLDLKNT